MARKLVDGYWVNDEPVTVTREEAWDAFYAAMAPEVARLALEDQAREQAG